MGSESKLKVRKFYGPILAFGEVTEEKQVGGSFCISPSWIGLRSLSKIINSEKFLKQLYQK